MVTTKAARDVMPGHFIYSPYADGLWDRVSVTIQRADGMVQIASRTRTIEKLPDELVTVKLPAPPALFVTINQASGEPGHAQDID